MAADDKPARPDAGGTTAKPRSLWRAVRALFRTRLVAGLLTLVPIWVTWVVIKFLFDTMKSVTEPIAWGLTRKLREEATQTVIPPEDLWRIRTDIIRQAVVDLVDRTELPSDLVDQEEALATKKQLIIEELVDKFSYVLDQVPDAPVGLISDSWLAWIVPVMSVVLTLFLLYVLGLLTASVFGRRIILLIEKLFEKLPLVKQVYRSTKQVVVSLGGGQRMNFKRVVLVEFPRPGMKCIGFLTAVMKDIDTGRQMASIFISTTPNPTTGYMQIVPLDEVSETGWTVEDAVKLLMSGGILSPPVVPFDKVHPVKWETDDEKTDEADAASRAAGQT